MLPEGSDDLVCFQQILALGRVQNDHGLFWIVTMLLQLGFYNVLRTMRLGMHT